MYSFFKKQEKKEKRKPKYLNVKKKKTVVCLSDAAFAHLVCVSSLSALGREKQVADYDDGLRRLPVGQQTLIL